MTAEDDDIPEVVDLPIDGTLDLHSFDPKEVKELVSTYLDECRAKGILEIRIVHGKGTGTLRRIVHSILEKRDDVEHWALAGGQRGGWGATVVTMRGEATGNRKQETGNRK